MFYLCGTFIKRENKMKAIVTNLKKASGYSRYNGYTFEVKEILSNFIALKIPSQLDIDRMDTIDFSFKEVYIIDLELELKTENEIIKRNLQNYMIAKKIKIYNK